MSEKSITEADLAQFTGTAHWYRHSTAGLRYTDGVRHVAEIASAHWLIDEIAFAQLIPSLIVEEFQHWTLTVDHAARIVSLTCEDGNNRAILRLWIQNTEFPLDELSLYYTDGILLLVSEY